MKIENSKLKLLEGVQLVINEFGAKQLFVTLYTPEQEELRLKHEKEVIDAGFVKHDGYWISENDALWIMENERAMQEHIKTIAGG